MKHWFNTYASAQLQMIQNTIDYYREEMFNANNPTIIDWYYTSMKFYEEKYKRVLSNLIR